MSVRHRTVPFGAMLAVTVLCGSELHAAPFRPANDDVVVETLSAATRGRPATAPRPAATTSGHADLDSSSNPELELQARVRGLIARGRQNADPRDLGRAEALLRAAPAVTPVPVERLVLQATIDQSLHRFDASVRGLDAVLAREPMHAQARLTRATVLQVQGHFDAAAHDCALLARVARPLVSTTCSTSVASLRGRAREAYVLLDFALRSAGDEQPEVLSWSRTVLAGIAERTGRRLEAETNYRTALALAPDDPFVLASYADLLLDAGDARRALALVQGRRVDDNLYLREAIALKRLGDPGLATAVAELAARFEAAHRRGQALHLREEARFELQVRDDARRALQLAQANWAVQREPADARILFEAAQSAGDVPNTRLALQWLEAMGVMPAGNIARRSQATRVMEQQS